MQILSLSGKIRNPGSTGLTFPHGKWLEFNLNIPLDGRERPVYHSPLHSLVYPSIHPSIQSFAQPAWPRGGGI